MDAKGDCHLLFVPVRESGSGVLALRTGWLPSGQRVGLACTSAAALLATLGPGQPWIRLHEDAMRDMLGPADRPDQGRRVPLRAAGHHGRCGQAPPRVPPTRAPLGTLTHQRLTTAMSHCGGQNHHAVTLSWLRRRPAALRRRGK